MGRWLTVEEIMAGSNLSPNAIHKLACAHKWRRIKTRPRLYLTEDVMKTLDERSVSA